MSSYDWRDLQFVLAVSEHGSLSTAAKALGVVPSTISRRLDALEASMGVELFHRQPSGYTLTKRGEYVIEALAPMPDLIKDWGRRVKSNTLEEITYVTLTAPSLVISRLNELLPAFFLAHPEIKLVLLDDNHVHDLQRSDADLAIRAIHQPEEDLWGNFLGAVELVIAASPGYIASMTSIEEAQWVVLDHAEPQAAISRWERAHVKPSQRLVETNSRYVLVELLKMGCGVGVLPKSIVSASDELEVVKTIDLPYPINLWILTKQELKGKPGIQETMRFFATHGRPLLSS